MEENQNLILIFDIYVNDEYTGQKEFKQESVLIGSGATAHISLPELKESGLSNLHAVCNVNEDASGSYVNINDLGGGGISINGQPISSSVRINTGDNIQIGSAKFVVKVIDMGFDGEETTQVNERHEDTLPQQSPPPAETTPAPAPTPEPQVAAQAAPPEPKEVAKSSFEHQDPAEAIRDSYLTEGGVSERFFDGPKQKYEDAVDFVSSFKGEPGSDLLEVVQILGSDIIDIKHFSLSGVPVEAGSEIGYRLRFAGRPVAWVPKPFSALNVLMYPFTQTHQEWKSDFFSDEKRTLFSFNGGQTTAHIPQGWTAQVKENDQFKDIPAGDVTLSAGQQLFFRNGASVYAAQLVKKKKSFYVGILTTIDAGMIGIAATVLLFGLASWLFYQKYKDFRIPEPEAEQLAEIYEAMLELEPEEESEEEDANEDAGEGAKAKEEEGKVGKEDSKIDQAKGDKIESKETQDKKVVDNFMSGLDFGSDADAGENMGSSAMDAFNGGLGGVLGAKGVQAGSGGLGASGGGFGGGGTADGIGGLGSKGMGRGRSGRGMGGGSFGKKRKRGSLGRIGGTPTILGGLDKSLIDAVIKRNMNQISYCYNRQLAKNPSLSGKITVKFVIAKDGSVSRASIDKSSLGGGGKLVESCVKGRFKKFKFPKPNGGIVIVKYPFIFSPS